MIKKRQKKQREKKSARLPAHIFLFKEIWIRNLFSNNRISLINLHSACGNIKIFIKW